MFRAADDPYLVPRPRAEQPEDLRERAYWTAHQSAYEEAIRATSRPWAPWYAVPGDDKRFMRLAVARILSATLQSLSLRYPAEPPPEALEELRRQLDAGGPGTS